MAGLLGKQSIGGLLGGAGSWLSQTQTANPEFFQGLGAGLLSGNMAGGFAQGDDARRQRIEMERAEALRREAMAQDQSQFNATFGLQQDAASQRNALLGSEAQEKRLLNSSTAKWLEAQGAAPELVQMAQAGAGADAFRFFQAGNSAPELPKLEEIYDQSGMPVKGYRNANNEFIPMGAPKAPSGMTMESDGNGGFKMTQGPMKAGAQTEGMRRQQQLTTVMKPELETIERTYDELADPKNQVGGWFGTPGNFVTSDGYKEARDSVSTVVRSYLYSVSGATATDDEVAAQTQLLLPKPGEPKTVVDAKKRRIRTMAEAVSQAAGNAPSGPAGNISGMSDAELEAIANGG